MNDNNWYISSCHFSDSAKEFKLTEVVKNDDEMKCYADMYYEEYQKDIIDMIRANIK